MTENRLAFQGGWRTVVGFAVAFVLVTAIWIPLNAAVANLSAWAKLATELGKFAVILGCVWILLQIDGTRFSILGLSRRHLFTALAAVSGIWVAMNVLGSGIAVVTGNDLAVSMIWNLPDEHPAIRQYGPLSATWLVFILLNFLVIGLVEEVAGVLPVEDDRLARRRHSVAHRSWDRCDDHRVRRDAHPSAIVTGKSLGGVFSAALAPTLTAVLFGVFYELTHNVYFVALLHGFGNTWPIVVEWTNWSGNVLIAFWIGTTCIYLGVTLAYRYWMSDYGSRMIIKSERFALHIGIEDDGNSSARLGSRPWRSWASAWNRLTANPLDTDRDKYDMTLDANLRRTQSWSTALQYIEDYHEWRPDR